MGSVRVLAYGFFLGSFFQNVATFQEVLCYSIEKEPFTSMFLNLTEI